VRHILAQHGGMRILQALQGAHSIGARVIGCQQGQQALQAQCFVKHNGTKCQQLVTKDSTNM
jgi:hypothetical protein